ncbi:MAG: hypothetical protein ACOVK7_08390, partial [Burkholderiaceae bacterium]
MAAKFIPIQPVAVSAPAPVVPAPVLAGPAETLQRVLRGLRDVVDREGVNLVRIGNSNAPQSPTTRPQP